MEQNATWGTWVGLGIFLLLLGLAIRWMWHLPVVQALWIAARYSPGTDPAKVRIHVSKQRRKQWDQTARRDRAARSVREIQAIREFAPHAATYRGIPNTTGLNLKVNEWIVANVSETGLVEDRSSGGGWMGGSSGFSIPLGHSRARYSTGRSYGQYVQAAPTPTVIDVGSTIVTNQRLLFRGHTQTRECLFENLVGYEFFADDSGVSAAVSNRQGTTRISYGPELGPWFSLRLRFAVAQFQGQLPGYLRDLQARHQVKHEVTG
jgi:hypothetical protein